MTSTPTRITHLIAGSAWEGTAERTSDVYNPATGEVTGALDLASADLVSEVVAGAKRAWQQSWGSVSLARRSQVLFKFRELLHRDKERIAALITAEHGKVHDDALGEVTRGLEVVEFACGIPTLMKGGFSENASTRVDVYSIRQSLGVVAVISPFNFPAMVPLWFVPVAIACGNAVVIKPSEKDPSATIAVAQLWQEAGLPDGVLNLVNGDKEAVDALLTHPDVKAVSFVGSTPIARYVYETGTAHGKRVQALGGAKNHMLVLPDADLDLAADAAINAGFGSAGERCMAISALVAVDSIADELVEKIRDRMGKLRTGDGTRGCDMGPLVTGAHRDKVTSYVEAGVAEGAELVVDGRDGPYDADGDGFFLAPTLFDRVTPGDVDLRRRDLRPRAVGPTRPQLRRGAAADQRKPLRQRHRDLHQGRRRGAPVPERGRGRHGRGERAHPGACVLLLLRRLEEQPLRGQPRARHRGRALLHPREGRDLALARPEPRRPQPRLPPERLSDARLGREPLMPLVRIDVVEGRTAKQLRRGIATRSSPSTRRARSSPRTPASGSNARTA